MTRGIRLLTANLLNGAADPDALAALVRKLEVDVIAVQELGLDQAAALQEVLPHGKLEPGRDHNGMGIGLRHPGEVQRLPLVRRPARVVELRPSEWPNLARPLEILNLHIQAPHIGWPWRTFAARRAQVRAVTQYLDEAPRSHRVLVGDLNATPAWPAYRRLAERLEDAAHRRASHVGDRPGRTWGPWPGSPRVLRIDHVLTAGFEISRAEVVPIEGSDHAGLFVELHPEADE